MIPDVQAYLGIINPDFSQIIRLTQLFGTPAYMSPEQVGGDVTQQTDIFSLGLTMYQMVTSFDTSSIYLMKEKKELWDINYTPPQQVNPYLPNWLAKMILKAIQIEPKKRYQTVAEMLRIFNDNQNRAKSQVTISIGDISNISGQIFIGDFNNVVANLNTRSQTDLAEALKIVKEAVMASNDLPNRWKKEQIEVINLIGNEATKPVPNWAYFRALVDGLVTNLKNVPVLANIITEITPFLTKSQLVV
jgi:serine/threonine protein kinase